MEKLINNVMIKISNCKGYKCSYLLIMRKFACSSTVTFTSLESMAYTTSLSLLLLLLLIFFFFLFVLADMINPHNSAKNIGTIQVICKERSNNKAIWDLAKGRHQDLLPLYLVLLTNVYYQIQYGDSSLLTLDNTPYKFPQGNTIVTSKPCAKGGPLCQSPQQNLKPINPLCRLPWMHGSLRHHYRPNEVDAIVTTVMNNVVWSVTDSHHLHYYNSPTQSFKILKILVYFQLLRNKEINIENLTKIKQSINFESH